MRLLVQLWCGCAPMFPAALPTHFTPADIIGQDVDDVRFLSESLFQGGQLFIDRATIRFQFRFVFSLKCQIRRFAPYRGPVAPVNGPVDS